MANTSGKTDPRVKTLSFLFVTAVTIAACSKSEAPSADSTAMPSATATTGTTPVRGTVSTASDSTLVVTTTAGDIRIAISSPLEVYSRGPAELSEVTASSFIGVTSVAQPDGSQNATEIHIFPEALRGTNEGTFLMQQQPGSASPSTMTNGTVQAPRMTNGTASAITGGKLVVDYRAGTQTITVPSGITVTKISRTETKLAPGSNVVVLATKRPDGTLTASRVLLAGGQ
jgi:hypothetical protein